MNKEYSKHYASMCIQPITYMQLVMSKEAFCGFLYGQVVKYHFRAGTKQGEPYEKDITKRDHYMSWLYHASKQGTNIVNPVLEYELPEDYKANVISLIEHGRDEIMSKQQLL